MQKDKQAWGEKNNDSILDIYFQLSLEQTVKVLYNHV